VLIRLLFAPLVKRGIVCVEILGIQPILGDAEGIGDFSVSNSRPKVIHGKGYLPFSYKFSVKIPLYQKFTDM
jgi:hypothetical protein